MDDHAWGDEFAIQELIFRYSDPINRGDLEATKAVFAPHAIWECPIFGMHFEWPGTSATSSPPTARASSS
jgi:hypothetical protein